jgi:N6-L-threonylcarbamoyladenine synthase
MITLGIETSCDETALCLLEMKDSRYRVLANIIHSQIDIHREFGGVFPMLAKREHIKNLPILYEKIIKDSGISENMIDRIAVTNGPGLEPALWTGILFAKELGKKLDIPVIPVNHMEGHIVSSFKDFKPPQFPALALLISGGHTELVYCESLGNYKILGSTVDDAVGEAFDKVARMMNLPYPGGPEISRLAELARQDNLKKEITLPRPMIHSKDLNFSFSGLKTAVLYLLKELGEIDENKKREIAREFEDSVVDVLISKTRTAIDENEVTSLIIGGGVIANKHIREAFIELTNSLSIPLYMPENHLTGDNALMIALVGTIKPLVESRGFIAEGNLSL